MPTKNGRQYTGVSGLNLKSSNGCIRFETPSITPTTTSGEYILYKNSSGQLIYDNGSSSTALGASGAIISYGLNDAYDDGAIITVDSGAVTLNGSHATNNVFAIAYTGSGTGNMIDIQNDTTGSAGSDIIGTGDSWSVSSAGAAVFTAVTGCDTLTAAANLAINATGAGTIAIGNVSTGAVTITPALTATASLTITGTADSTVLTVTAGDVAVSNGIVTIDSDDTTTGQLSIPSSACTSGNVVHVVADDLTSGAMIYLDSDNGASFSGDGGYINCTDGTNSVFKIQRYGAVTIAGNAEGTASLTCTKGDVVLTDGALVITAGAFTYTAGDMTMSDGSLAITDADDAASFSVTNNTATSASVVAFAGSGVFTGTTTASWMTITPSGLTSGTGVYAIGAGLTTGKLMHLATDATMTSGTILNVQCTGADDATTSGMAASFDMTATGIASSVNKTGSVVSITSNRTVTTGGTTADDFDCLSVIKTTTHSAGTAATAGSAVYAEISCSGTVTETSNGIEVKMDSGGTGDGVKVTHAATGGKALNIISAATSVSDVLITSSGVKASAKAALEVVTTGSTAAGGAILRVAHGGTGDPAAATSYTAVFSQSSATCANNPVCVYIDGGASTAADLQLTKSGSGYSLQTINTNTGATGVQWYSGHQAGSSEADNDVVFTMHIAGNDDAHAAETYAKIICTAIDVSAADPDGKLDFQIDVAGTSTSMLYLQSSTAGATTCVVGAAASTFAGSAAGTAAVTVTNGDISLSAGKFISTTTADIYGLDVTVNKATATQGVAVFTNASTTSGKAVLELEQADLDKPYIKFSGATAVTSATAGSNGDVPAQVQGYLKVDIDGAERLIPYYAT